VRDRIELSDELPQIAGVDVAMLVVRSGSNLNCFLLQTNCHFSGFQQILLDLG
jgi:hypothetical protein